MNDIEKVLAAADVNIEAGIERLFDLVRIPSISADPAYRTQCRQAAERLNADLLTLGLASSIRDTPGQPMVVAHSKGAAEVTPHVLFYGHYDVQPADPLEKWATPPFEPVRQTDAQGRERFHGRGTADDKGQFMTFIEAARAWIAVKGALPFRATFLFEGEEESGSPSLVPFLQANKEELSCDTAFICDTNMWDARHGEGRDHDHRAESGSAFGRLWRPRGEPDQGSGEGPCCIA
jgi:acetylornithine deacetylase/succinyl-diaminopimelate desuccinylase-like protein